MRKDPFAVALRKFLVDEPLYRSVPLRLPPLTDDFALDEVLLDCPQCEAERPYFSTEAPKHRTSGLSLSSSAPPKLVSGVYELVFVCFSCRSRATYWVDVDTGRNRVRKVGQVPPKSLALPRELEDTLGDDAELLKRAKICLNQSYGLGACAYMRRTLENRMNDIIRQMIALERKQGDCREEVVEELERVLKAKHLTEKTEVAYRASPPSLIIEGENPLKLLHEFTSAAIHELNEDECTDRARLAVAALEYVLRELTEASAARNGFVAAVREIRSRAGEGGGGTASA